MTHEMILYRTMSVCPKCCILDKKGLVWTNAVVKQSHHTVHLVIGCTLHGSFTLEYSANADHFKRALIHSLPRSPTESLHGFIGDIENIQQAKKAIQLSTSSKNLPSMIELSVFDGEQPVSDDDLRQQIILLTSSFPPSRQFVLKVKGELAADMELLNEKVLFVERTAPTQPAPLLLDVSFERLMLLIRLPDSCLLNRRIYPCIKYYIPKGMESEVEGEINSALEELEQEITGIQVMIDICVERPFPVLTNIIANLREKSSMVRVVNISMERPPREIIANVALNPAPVQGTVDISELLTNIEEDTRKDIVVEEFFPTTMLITLEPLLSLMGWGKYMLRPSPSYGFATVLLNTDTLRSVPISRLMDVDKFYESIASLLPQLSANQADIGILLGTKLRKILKTCARPGQPDLFTVFANDQEATFLSRSQVWIVHREIDFGALDLQYVVRPCVLTKLARQLWKSFSATDADSASASSASASSAPAN
ncbi:hypothetical protein, variant [Capsaspora owczarzaki ATCC 30864]|nr:hypothetical protein, variant [Capsaspora owczarzaki ATCC 30864]KJE91939.1 hypothetical protein, variant 1 [Capsaspora owczarzaki ATCC 30864]KJE91940.1 hypothetical protein, variant 2 [Capsaspora owczarzaki ATCC 30864]KJE91941.1 hypothetical protein, variant 3 [Capsaspora owczarzaki ATCC 30864]|eukprot:XP_011270235.1 hypothetical protein, variant [Capsaspora owczarzaki ATCC 30864]